MEVKNEASQSEEAHPISEAVPTLIVVVSLKAVFKGLRGCAGTACFQLGDRARKKARYVVHKASESSHTDGAAYTVVSLAPHLPAWVNARYRQYFDELVQ